MDEPRPPEAGTGRIRMVKISVWIPAMWMTTKSHHQGKRPTARALVLDGDRLGVKAILRFSRICSVLGK